MCAVYHNSSIILVHYASVLVAVFFLPLLSVPVSMVVLEEYNSLGMGLQILLPHIDF